MARRKLSTNDTLWLNALGDHLRQKILQRGYKSPYEFWIQSLGDEVSRASLNYILNGRVDVRATTLKRIADALEMCHSELFDFDRREK